MEANLLIKGGEAADNAAGTAETSQTGQERTSNPRAVKAAAYIKAVMIEQGIDMRTLDPYGDFDPEVREILGENGDGQHQPGL